MGAAYVLDTGPGPSDSLGGLGLFNDGQLAQFLGVQFSVGTDTTLASIEGWMNERQDIGATGTVAVYTNENGLPGSELFSALFVTAGPGPEARWEGAHGLSWDVAPGTYFATFEVRPGQTLDGAMPTGVTNPSTNYVYYDSDNVQWLDGESEGGGFRINAVPLPAPILLLVSALISLPWFRKSPSITARSSR